MNSRGLIPGSRCLILLACLAMCRNVDAVPAVQPFTDSAPPPRLSELNLFKDPPGQVPNDGVVPYEMNSPGFSDYAAKHRFVWLPPGTAAKYDDRQVLEFPVGTMLIKTFGFLKDLRKPGQDERLLETRLLVRKPSGWGAYTYLWNDEEDDAYLWQAGKLLPLSWIHLDGSSRSQNYVVPNVNTCKQCHQKAGSFEPIGPKARQLNGFLDYGSGKENQLDHWSKIGYLTGHPGADAAPRAPVWDDPSTGTLDERARAYLDINCAHCHSPGGSAYTSGLDLDYYQTSPFRIGIQKHPVAAGRAASIGRVDIEPGSPETSILLYRLETTDPGTRMPVAGRTTKHEEGTALIREWILQMPLAYEPAEK